MALDELEVLINLSVFDDDLDELLAKLTSLEALAQSVDDINVDVDVHGERALDALMARLAAIEAMQIGGVGPSFTGAGGAGGGAGAAEATDEAAEAARSAAKAMDEAEDASHLFNLRMSDLHNLLAKLVPILVVFIGALPAAIAGIVALGAAAFSAAAAMAAIAGFGALGFAMQQGGPGNMMEGFSQIIEQIRSDFLDAFGPLARQMSGLFEDALDGLDMLFQAVANRGDVLLALRDDARALGGFLLDFIPNTLEAMGRMAEAFGPVFGMLSDFISEMDLLSGLSQFFADALPTLIKLGQHFAEFIPTLTRVSLGFLEMTNVIFFLLDGLGMLLSFLPMNEEAFGLLTAGILTAITALNLFSLSAIRTALASLAALGTRVLALISTYSGYTASTVVATAATYGLSGALLTLIGIATLGVGLVAVAGAAQLVADHFFNASAGIRDATQSLRDFKSVGDSLAGPGENPYGVGAPTKTGGATFVRGGGSGGGGNSVTLNYSGGDADEENVRNTTYNALYRLNASRRRGSGGSPA